MDSHPVTEKTQLLLEYEALKIRHCEVDYQIAEAIRAEQVDGIPTTRARMSTLRAELKKITLDLHKMKQQAMLEKRKAQEYKSKSFAALLSAKCIASGMGHLVEEASAESLELLKDTDMFGFYKTVR